MRVAARLRLRREISKDIERGRREILADLLEVVDNLDRAIDSGRQAASADALLQGVVNGTEFVIYLVGRDFNSQAPHTGSYLLYRNFHHPYSYCFLPLPPYDPRWLPRDSNSDTRKGTSS